MSVNLIETDKAGLQKFYEEIIGKFETYAPVEQFGKYDYKKVSRLSECNPDSPIETTMSIKPLFLPKTAKVMKFREDNTGTTLSETDEDPLTGKRVILGEKHCDARGLQVLDQVYKWDYIDNDYHYDGHYDADNGTRYGDSQSFGYPDLTQAEGRRQ